ncbi:MAG: hypothetical protein NWE89_04065 [Candidatus Bathyarchaeota archaeon]|nr:hypothetical protein [Candidatus Bathyarchaeota archaeon]
MQYTDEDLKRCVLEILYRNRSEKREPVEQARLAAALDADEAVLGSNIAELEAEGIIDVRGDAVSLTDEGYMIITTRQFSYCPHL